MTTLLDRDVPSTSARSPQQRSPKRRLTVPILLQLGAMLGIGALVYASAADWFATLNHNAEISGYVEEVAAMPDDVRKEKLAVARAYNAHMPAGVLRDPFTADAAASDLAEDSAYQTYEQVLRVSDRGVIGEIAYPSLGIGLPIYHGTSDEVISKGAGHLYGSSLPVGGPSTHSVLTAHSGLARAALFTPLTGARIGDEFQVTVLGETHSYRVDSIETVLPEETESLSIVPGEEYVTLITCTPTGINSHRLLVRGVRVAGPDSAGTQVVAGDGSEAGFPWWAVLFVGGSALSAALIFSPPRSRRAVVPGSQAQGSQAQDAHGQDAHAPRSHAPGGVA